LGHFVLYLKVAKASGSEINIEDDKSKVTSFEDVRADAQNIIGFLPT
jgi:hypothetical protein